MSASRQTRIARLRGKLAIAEAEVTALRGMIAALEQNTPLKAAPAKPSAGTKPEAVDLKPLWDAALKVSRGRSSKVQCRAAWNRIPAAERPSLEEAIAALKKWNRSDEWTRDACLYARGLHRFIQARLWESVPEVAEAPSRTPRKKPEPAPAPAAEDLASPEDQAAIFSSIQLG